MTTTATTHLDQRQSTALAEASDPHTEPQDLAMILMHGNQQVQLAVAQNPATTSDLLLHLSRSRNPRVRQAAFARRNRG